jgi:hypothetical protein
MQRPGHVPGLSDFVGDRLSWECIGDCGPTADAASAACPHHPVLVRASRWPDVAPSDFASLFHGRIIGAVLRGFFRSRRT